MHVGGILSRERAGVRVMHLAEVLAATETTEVAQLPQGSDTAGAGDTGAGPRPSPAGEWP
jgi:L-lactate dehydrogenase complex protein LldE